MSLPTLYAQSGNPTVTTIEGAFYARNDAAQGALLISRNGVWLPPSQVQSVATLPAGAAFWANKAWMVVGDDGSASGGSAVTVGFRVWNGTNWVIATLRNPTTGGAGSVTLGGDVVGPSSTNLVTSISGNSGVVQVNAHNFNISDNVVAPTWIQAASAGAVNGQPFTITTQPGGSGGGARTGGPLNLNASAGSGGGLPGSVNLQIAGVTKVSLLNTGVIDELLLTVRALAFDGSIASPIIQHNSPLGGGATNLSIIAQTPFGGGGFNPGGNINLITGSGVSGGEAGVINFEWGGVGFAAAFDHAFNGLNMQSPNITWSSTIASPKISQATIAGSPHNLTMQAQGSSSTQGAHLFLNSGSGNVAGNVGAVQIGGGGNGDSWLTINPLGNWLIISGNAAVSGASPVTVGPITSNNTIEIFMDQVITTPPPDLTGATVIGGLRGTYNGQAIFIPFISDTT